MVLEGKNSGEETPEHPCYSRSLWKKEVKVSSTCSCFLGFLVGSFFGLGDFGFFLSL